MVKSLGDAVHQLLDRKQPDQQSGERDSRIERGNRRPRRQAETPKTSEVVDVAKPDQAKCHAENNDADNDLDDQARRAVQGIGDRGEVEMIIAAGGDRGADENSIDEQRGSYFLQPQPGMADGSRDDVKHDRQRKAEAQQPAKHHQDQFELERSAGTKLEKLGVKIVKDVDKAGFQKIADPYLDKLAKELGPHADKIKTLIRAIN